MPILSRLPRHAPLICGLVVTRIVGWGSTFYALSVLGRQIERDLGLGSVGVFGGITLFLVTGAALGPAVGRRLDREGTRRALCAGSVICGLGLALLGFAQGTASYLACWFLIGVGHALSLANVATVTVVQITGAKARRAIGLMMLATGLASSIFWPLTAALSDVYGWRATWFVFGAMQVLIALPIHAAVPRHPHGAWARPGPIPMEGLSEAGRVAPEYRRAAFWLVALIFSVSGMVSWGLPLHLIDILRNAGLDQAEAVGIAALAGPATLLARLAETAAAERLPVERAALAGLLVGPLANLLLVFAPGSSAAATGFVLAFSAAMGVISVARATLPLALFGRNGFAATLGRLNVPLNLAFAASPLLFAAMIERTGQQATLAAAAALQCIAFLAMLALMRLLARPVPIVSRS